MSATLVCHFRIDENDPNTQITIINGIYNSLTGWERLGAGRGSHENWYIGPSEESDCYGLYFAGAMNEDERRA